LSCGLCHVLHLDASASSVVSRNAHARPLCLTTNMKIKNMVNQGLRLLNGIAMACPAAPAAKIGLNIALVILTVSPAGAK
jgi:hypothetical protein